MIEEFERHLRGTNLSENTISSYLFAIRQYNSQYDGITKKNLRAYKVWLIENYKPKTVNLRLKGNQLLFGEHRQRELENAVCASTAESLSGKCHQRGRL